MADLDASYPGGLAAYLSKAKVLLKESAQGINPFADYTAVVPEGESLSYDGDGSMPFSDAEQLGLQHMAGVVFVLVAGGLGERLGYSGIKLSLSTNLCTDKCYLEIYAKYIQAMQVGRKACCWYTVSLTTHAFESIVSRASKDGQRQHSHSSRHHDIGRYGSHDATIVGERELLWL